MEADVPMGEGGDSGSASSTYGPCGRRMCGLVGNGCQGDAGVVGEFTIRRSFTHWVFKRGAFVVPFSASSVCGKLPSPTTSQTSARPRRLGSARDTQCRLFFCSQQLCSLQHSAMLNDRAWHEVHSNAKCKFATVTLTCFWFWLKVQVNSAAFRGDKHAGTPTDTRTHTHKHDQTCLVKSLGAKMRTARANFG